MAENRTVSSFRASHTKIVATLGPACQTDECLANLIEAGVDVFRLNAAHGDVAQHQQRLEAVRRVSGRLGQPVGVLMDLAGPKMRLGELPGGQLQLQRRRARVRFVRGTPRPPTNLPQPMSRWSTSWRLAIA